MQLKDAKYILMTAFISAIVWFAILQIDYRANLLLFRSLGDAGCPLVSGIIAFVIGTYLGLWSIGKVRQPSPAYGILIGLISLAPYFLLIALDYWIFSVEHGWPFSVQFFGDYYLSEFERAFDVIASLVGGVVGVVIVRRISPSFCPNCGSKLPPGSDPCPKCGTKTF